MFFTRFCVEHTRLVNSHFFAAGMFTGKRVVSTLLIWLFCFSGTSHATTYCVDPAGISEVGCDDVVQTIADVNMLPLAPGDSVLFKRGELWREGLSVTASGLPGNEITFDAYGNGPNPVITPSIPFSGWLEYSLIDNAGFERPHGDPNRPFATWSEQIDDTSSGAYIIRGSNEVLQGNYSAELHLGSTLTNVFISPAFSVPLEAGQTYNIRFSNKVTNGGLMKLRLRLKITDGSNNSSYLYLNPDNQWQTWNPIVDQPYTNTQWQPTNITFTAPSEISNSETYAVDLYFFNNTITNSTVWVDDVYLAISGTPNGPRIWQGYLDDLGNTTGILMDGVRVPSFAGSARMDPGQLNNGEFTDPVNQPYFYFRHDEGAPPEVEIGRYEQAILINGASNIVVQNIDAYGPVGSTNANGIAQPDLVRVTASSSITLRNMDLSRSFGIGATIRDATTGSSFDGLTSHDHGNTCLYFWEAGSGNSAINSMAYDCGNMASDAGDKGIIGAWMSPNTRIEGCEAFNNGYSGAANLDAGISFVQSTGAVVTRNYIHDTGGIGMQLSEDSDDCEASYNVIDSWSKLGGSRSIGIRIGGGVGTGFDKGGITNCLITNNLFIHGEKNNTSCVEVEDCLSGSLVFNRSQKHINIEVRNNIFYDNISVDYELKVEPGNTNTEIINPVFTNNIYYRTQGNSVKWLDDTYGYDRIIGNTTGFYSFDNNLEQNSKAEDPLLSNAPIGDYVLSANSGAINNGFSTGHTIDIAGNPIIGVPDIGPFEFQPDFDGDGVTDSLDNCPQDANLNQSDADSDGIGNVCDNEQLVFTSLAAEDGWVRESSETSNIGGSSSATGAGNRPVRFGDDNNDRQFKAIVSFNTASLPAGSTVRAASLELTRGRFIGNNNPYSVFGTAWVDLSVDGFDGNPALNKSDFEAPANVIRTGQLTDDGTLATAILDATGQTAIEGSNLIQLRIAFGLDDNDDRGKDFTGYYSGDYGDSGKHPRLIIQYTLPD